MSLRFSDGGQRGMGKFYIQIVRFPGSRFLENSRINQIESGHDIGPISRDKRISFAHQVSGIGDAFGGYQHGDLLVPSIDDIRRNAFRVDRVDERFCRKYRKICSAPPQTKSGRAIQYEHVGRARLPKSDNIFVGEILQSVPDALRVSASLRGAFVHLVAKTLAGDFRRIVTAFDLDLLYRHVIGRQSKNLLGWRGTAQE